MRHLAVSALALLFITINVFAQKVKTVSGTYIYVVPETQSFFEAKETAIQRAKIQILADTFGTVMDMSSATSISQDGAQTHALSQSQVKGEWLETVGTPAITKLFEGDKLAIRVEIKGKIRQVVSSTIDFTAKPLCGAPDLRFANDNFASGDDMFLYFQAPGDGYIAVYLYDGGDDVFCLLPYQRQTKGVFPVKGGKEYIFFSTETYDGDTPVGMIDEYTLNASSDLEMNRIYVIYSPNRFTKAVDSCIADSVPRNLSFNDFQKWLSHMQAEDNQVGVKSIDITIRAK